MKNNASPLATPMMKQYLALKEKYADSILFYRMGDFYEMFFEDAKKAAPVLGIALTSRNKAGVNSVPMCGIPHHAADSYIGRLIKAGLKVAVCEQIEDPKTAKGIVKRDVVRIVTPGTLLDSSLLDARENNFLASVCSFGKGWGIAFVDISTGDFRVTEFQGEGSFQKLQGELEVLKPKEVLIPEGLKEGNGREKIFPEAPQSCLNYYPD